MRLLILAIASVVSVQSAQAQLSAGGVGGIDLGGGMRYGAVGGADLSPKATEDSAPVSTPESRLKSIPAGYAKWLSDATGIEGLEVVSVDNDYSFKATVKSMFNLGTVPKRIYVKAQGDVTGVCNVVTSDDPVHVETKRCYFSDSRSSRNWVP